SRPERRVAARRPCRSDVLCRLLDPRWERPWPAWVWNLSSTGACVLSWHRPAPGAMLTLELEAPGRDFLRRLLVQVRHAEIYCPNASWMLGCAFARKLTREELEALAG